MAPHPSIEYVRYKTPSMVDDGDYTGLLELMALLKACPALRILDFSELRGDYLDVPDPGAIRRLVKRNVHGAGRLTHVFVQLSAMLQDDDNLTACPDVINVLDATTRDWNQMWDQNEEE